MRQTSSLGNVPLLSFRTVIVIPMDIVDMSSVNYADCAIRFSYPSSSIHWPMAIIDICFALYSHCAIGSSYPSSLIRCGTVI